MFYILHNDKKVFVFGDFSNAIELAKQFIFKYDLSFLNIYSKKDDKHIATINKMAIEI